MKKWYKVFSPWMQDGVITHHMIAYIDNENINDACIILKEYDSKEEMIKELSK